MSATATFDPDQILKTLQLHRVRFVVIGGLAAEVHDCGWTTFDLDIIVATEPENFDALETALSALEAVYNDPAGRRIVPTAHRMTTLRGPQLLRTKAGRLDVLREAGGETFETLAADALVTGDGTMIASLPALHRMKRAAGRPKDREGLELIEAALRDRK